MKRLTLDQTWTECLKMWRWIVREIEAGTDSSASRLKIEWMKNHGYNRDTYNDCFFCEYMTHKGRAKGVSGAMCPTCPASQVDVDFDCMSREYHWNVHPIAFLRKLEALNRKRKKH